MVATERYTELIRYRLAHPLPDNEYGECHHIVPKSCGGLKLKDNLIRLTIAEHYEAHKLLKDIYSTGKEHRSMVFAWRTMVVMNGAEISMEEYANIRKQYAEQMSEALKGHTVSDETKQKISNKLKGRVGNRKGSHHSDKTKKLLSELSKGNKNSVGRKASPETRRKISEALKGNKNRIGGKKVG